MTQAEKLEALVKKAVENGLNWTKLLVLSKEVEIEWWVENDENPDDPFVVCRDKKQGEYSWSVELSKEQIIFNKDFVRALFGDAETKDSYGGVVEFYDFGGKDFQYHLMVAAISDDPIDYLYKAAFAFEPTHKASNPPRGEQVVVRDIE